MTIEGLVFKANTRDDPHRHRQIEGYCENIAAGEVRVGFHIGKCNGYSVGDGRTGWNSVSRIMIAEVPPVQLFAQEPEVPLCPRLGWSTWLPGHAEFESDRDETSFQITS